MLALEEAKGATDHLIAYERPPVASKDGGVADTGHVHGERRGFDAPGSDVEPATKRDLRDWPGPEPAPTAKLEEVALGRAVGAGGALHVVVTEPKVNGAG
jgi:hypothetical protein